MRYIHIRRYTELPKLPIIKGLVSAAAECITLWVANGDPLAMEQLEQALEAAGTQFRVHDRPETLTLEAFLTRTVCPLCEAEDTSPDPTPLS
jgi:hypothetical protein